MTPSSECLGPVNRREIRTLPDMCGCSTGFKCSSQEQVQQFHDVAVAHGGTSIEEPPGLREGKMGAMYLSYVRDPDGNKLCALFRPA